MTTFDWSSWDASKAWHGGATASDPAAFYRGICAGKKAGDPSKQSSWALPYRYTPSSPPNAAGVRNALSRLPQTKGLTNETEARNKLQGLMKQIQAAEKNRDAVMHEMRMYRMEHRSELPGGDMRRKAFPSEMRGKFTKVDGRSVYEVEGYATVYNRGYEMWDKAGSYTEIVGPHALDRSLATSPNVAFLVNHKGVAMARTRMSGGRNPSLLLRSDSTGLQIQAWLNAERQDVRDLAHAIDDGDVEEMSFAFRIEDYSWDEDYTELSLTNLDIDRGDVSAVNFGANPFTHIAARAADWLEDFEHMPTVVVREVLNRLHRRSDADTLMPEFRTAAAAVIDRNAEMYERAAEANEEAARLALDEDDMADAPPAPPRKTRNVAVAFKMLRQGSLDERREQLQERWAN